jgi:hypothetical protein
VLNPSYVAAWLAKAGETRLPVFDERERTDDRPRARTEGLFAFYDRVPRRPFTVFRDVVNEWMAEMPAEAATEIVARMRTGEDLGFATGFGEIMLHAAFRRLGFSPEPHPMIPGTSNRPDFLLRRSSQERVAYVEITTMNPPTEEVSRGHREAVVFEALNRATLPDDLRLSYEVTSYGTASPSLRRIRPAVKRWAAKHAEAARAGTPVREILALDDWRFSLALMSGFAPRPGGRQIALYGLMNGRFVGPAPSTEGLAGALDTKAAKYGELDLPYVIAVFDCTNSLAWFSTGFPGKVAEALFGSERVLCSEDGRFAERARDGWFGYTGAPRHRSVSAVLVFPSADPWYLAQQRGQPLLVKHPWATRPLPDGILPTHEFVIDDRDGRVVPGRMMSEILCLPRPWPLE